MKKFILSVSFSFLFLLSVFGVSAAQPEDETRAMTAQSNIWSSFDTDPVTGGYVYPDECGGMYIDESDFYLVVTLATDSEVFKNQIRELSKDADIVKFESVKYSYTQLSEVLTEIQNSIDTYNFSVAMAGIQEKTNSVQVNVHGGDIDIATEFLRGKYGDMVTLHSGEYEFVDEEEIGSLSPLAFLGDTDPMVFYINFGVLGALLIASIIALITAPKKSSAPAYAGKSGQKANPPRKSTRGHKNTSHRFDANQR
ncbi:MAG: hypothetical protein LBL82_02595 [Oscillospiraceae bacterium]|nr:hypothetical protein [Oscillospiraceae bacterium]